MTDPKVTAVRIRHGDTVFHVHGELGGKEGVFLAQGQVNGIYDSPVKSTWKTGAFQVGSRQKGHKHLHRDLNLGFHVKEITTFDHDGVPTLTSYELNESAFRQVFDYELDRWDSNQTPTTIEVETTLSGIRKIDVLMYEQPEFASDLDPIMQEYGNLILKLRAGQPMWYEDDIVTTFSETTSSASGFITVENPTDQTMYHKLILTRATWTIPDNQWIGRPGQREPGGPNADRTLSGIVCTETNGVVVVDWDRSELTFRDANNTNVIGQMAGKFVNYAIPPHTPPTDLPISYSSAPTGGAMAQLVQPRRWSRPWGMEHILPIYSDTHSPLFTRFQTPGNFTYTIPDWADAVDRIILGGGGGGGGGGLLLTGTGGSAGAWAYDTLTRDQFPPDMKLRGIIGHGGDGGGAGILQEWNGLDGGATMVGGTGVTQLTAAGGEGSGHDGHVSGDDVYPGGGNPIYVNGVPYRGGDTAGMPSTPGNPPGGGGAGGWPTQRGGDGARGQAWFRAYQTGGS